MFKRDQGLVKIMELQKRSEVKNTQPHMNCVDEVENHEIQADRGQLTAKERNFSQGSLEPVGATVEQLAAEEQTIRQERKKARDGDTIQEEDFEQAAEEGSTQENVLKQKKKTEKTQPESLRVPSVRQSTKFKGKSAAAVAPMPEFIHDNTAVEQAWDTTFNVTNNDVTTRSHVSSSVTTNQENFETQAVGGQLPAEESTVPINNQEEKCKTGFDAEAAVEQLTAEEKNIRQARREPDKGDTIQEEDSKQASKEGYIQENELQQVKITKGQLKKTLDLLGLGGSFIVPDENGLISKGKKPLAHYGCANMNGPIYYKGNSSPARTIMLESVGGDTDAEQAWAKDNSSTTTNVTNNYVTTRSHVSSPDETDEHPYKDAIFRLGARDSNWNDIIILDAGRLPQKENFRNKKDFDNEARYLISYIEIFIHAFVDTHHFVLIVHPGDDTRCRTKSSQMGRKIYKLLKDCFSDRLAKCIIYKPQFKLRAALNLRRPFMKREMRQKIVMTKSRRNLEETYGIPEAVVRCL